MLVKLLQRNSINAVTNATGHENVALVTGLGQTILINIGHNWFEWPYDDESNYKGFFSLGFQSVATWRINLFFYIRKYTGRFAGTTEIN